ncbi:MAG: hypothetical protein KC656_31015, partial [Myxococcales bacterium]|nr:hypothetical protein [Myxococcales bacterium]
MLFNSYDFLFFFLPLCLAGHHLLRQWVGPRAAWVWVTLASLVFYAWWYVPYLGLLLASMAFNFGVGKVVADEGRAAGVRRGWLTAGVTANLVVLGWFKYAGFLDTNLAALGLDLPIPRFALPL